MITLYTRQENIRYDHFALLVLYAEFLIGIKWQNIKQFLIVLGVFCLLHVKAFLKWYPQKQQKKKAFLYGKIYQGNIINVTSERSKFKERGRHITLYKIIVVCDIDGIKTRLVLGDYDKEPYKYLPKDNKCNVYLYKGKCYVKNFTRDPNDDSEYEKALRGVYDNKELCTFMKYSIKDIPKLTGDDYLNAITERIAYTVVKSKTHMIVEPYSIQHYEKTLADVFVEVAIDSKKSYNAENLNLNERIDKYVRLKGKEYKESDKKKYIEEIKGIVRNTIREKNNRILIKGIDVVVCSYETAIVKK